MKTSSGDRLKQVTPSHFLQVRDSLHRFRNRLGLKNRKITGEGASANEGAAATFPAEMKKLLRVQYYPWFGGFGDYPPQIKSSELGGRLL